MDKSTLQIVLSAKDDLSKELVKVQKELTKLSNEFKKGKTTSKQAADSITKDLKKIDNEATNVRGGIKKLVGTFQGLGAMRLFGAIGALLALRKAMLLTKDAMFKAADFEKVMSDVNTLFNDTGENVARLEKGIKNMVKSMPIDPNELGKAAYQIVSAGISDTSEALKVLEASGKLATAGLSTTAEAADILTSAVNTFSKDGLTSAEIANVLFKTVKAGKTTVAELAQAFGATAPMVAEAGVKFKDFQAATAALTTTGLPAAQAQNALRGAMSALIKTSGPMKELLAKIGEEMGIDNMKGRDLIATTDNMGQAFDLLRKASKKHNISLEEAFGRVEALNAVYGLTDSVVGSYVNTLESVNDATDLLTEGFLKQQKTMTAQWQLIKNQVNVALIDLGSKVFPIVLKAINTGIGAVEGLINIYSKLEEFITGYLIPALVGLAASFAVIFVTGKVQAIGWAAVVTKAFDAVWLSSIKLGLSLDALKVKMLAIPGLNLAIAIGFAVTEFVRLMKSIKQTNKELDENTEAMIKNVDAQIKRIKATRGMEVIAESATNEKVKQLLLEKVEWNRRAQEGMTEDFRVASKERMRILREEIAKSPQARLELAKLAGIGDIEEIEAEIAQTEEILKSAKKEYNDFGKTVSKIWIELQLAHEKSIEKITNKLSGLSDKYNETQIKGSEAIAKLKENSANSLKDIDKSISNVNQSMADLIAEFEKTKISDRRGIGQVFVEAEERVKDLKKELARATDVQQILDIKNQIKAEEDALAKSADVRKQFSIEIAEAQRRAGLSDIQRAVEDFNSKRELAELEFNAKMSDLQTEKQALIEKRALEKQMYLDKIEDQKVTTLLKLKSILEEKVALLQQQKEEVTLFKQKEDTILGLITEAQAERTRITLDAHNQTAEAVEAEIQLYNELAAAIKSAASASVGSLITPTPFGGIPLGNRATGGPIQQSGMYNLHQGEYILNRRESRGVGGIVVNINGGTYLSEQVAEEIGDKIISKLKTNTRL